MVAELIHDYAHEAHEIKEAHKHADPLLPAGKKVNPLMHALGKTTSAVIKGLPQLVLFGLAAALITGLAIPALQGAAPSLGSIFGFVEGGFKIAAVNTSLLALPAVGAAIKAIIEGPKAFKEAEQHNDRVDGKVPAVSRGRGHSVTAEEGVIATVGAMDKAPAVEEAWHPAQDRGGRSFVAQHRPDGPITGADRVAAMVEAERAARSEQSL